MEERKALPRGLALNLALLVISSVTLNKFLLLNELCHSLCCIAGSGGGGGGVCFILFWFLPATKWEPSILPYKVLGEAQISRVVKCETSKIVCVACPAIFFLLSLALIILLRLFETGGTE